MQWRKATRIHTPHEHTEKWLFYTLSLGETCDSTIVTETKASATVGLVHGG